MIRETTVTDLEALNLLWMIPAALVLLVVAIPLALAVYAGLHWSRYDDKEMYLHG
ncbi:hypothetical protein PAPPERLAPAPP_03020 [Brevundimonas phage vB_BpoS-Papperlapapp]|uniref:Uncharacterized protein n=3 Tax=Marchewkavirus TaxID=3425052 RepID=A0A9E7SJM7_9CAUD|nr:hypothetical protein KABACHOK_01390 [Brevundimonas phage vB_BpoS-Kabachok]USN14672.1 hypothetical protein DOMOVOI_01980 [Brevundimonas phage vB_BpoS-Domovoi]USN16043.1 hypothetical protein PAPPERLAPAPP_03020 [Brevundimonas phage vB_BpoS-Papperlapapp]UTC28811.1 hypothetical protein MARCHEWKA_02990 [Brevundimonas phage vB_BpoS-Marchewka]UTC29258.1 hypothetical protein BAMBUS_01760 [Brevundimonas phage vB_BpoS-Bambus]